MGVVSIEARGAVSVASRAEKPSAPYEYNVPGLLPIVISAELAAHERNPIVFKPGERDQLVRELEDSGLALPRGPLLPSLQVPQLLRDPRVLFAVSAAFLIANR